MHPRAHDILNHYNITAEDLRKEYFKDKKISKATSGIYADLCSDFYFVEAIHRILKVQAEKSSSPTYYYNFSYSGQVSLTKALLPSPIVGNFCFQ